MADNSLEQMKSFHWMIDMMQNIDAGLVVLNRDNQVQLWNAFMENHSGLMSSKAIGCNLFELFPEIPSDWFQHKVESVFQLRTRAFSIWEQRPYIFKFKNYRPITGSADFMYQNISIIPLVASDGSINHICIIVYDVTDSAVGSLALESANTKLADLSRTDQLTQLYNRGYWQARQEQEFALVKRHGQPSSLIIFDIDHFKRVNDTYGHQAGDQVIRQCADTLKQCARDLDICGRYGGEEFVIVLQHTDAKGAYIFAERLRQKIAALQVPFGRHLLSFQISLGICSLTPQVDSAEQWIALADEALYQSKQQGRNRSTLAQCSSTDE